MSQHLISRYLNELSDLRRVSGMISRLVLAAAVLASAAMLAGAILYQHRYQVATIGTDLTNPSSSLRQTFILDTLTGRTWLLEARAMKDNPAVSEQTWEPLGYTQSELSQPRQEQRDPY
jgi:hypothetical protein